MKDRPRTVVAIVLALRALALAENPQQAWEYAILIVHPQLGVNWQTPEDPGTDGLLLVDKKLPTESEFYAKLGGTKAKANLTRLDLLNQIGKQGWELVSMSQHTEYIFKRPAKRG